jgi:hypothetical protein
VSDEDFKSSEARDCARQVSGLQEFALLGSKRVPDSFISTPEQDVFARRVIYRAPSPPQDFGRPNAPFIGGEP